jgi:hypothetical protein
MESGQEVDGDLVERLEIHPGFLFVFRHGGPRC